MIPDADASAPTSGCENSGGELNEEQTHKAFPVCVLLCNRTKNKIRKNDRIGRRVVILSFFTELSIQRSTIGCQVLFTDLSKHGNDFKLMLLDSRE